MPILLQAFQHVSRAQHLLMGDSKGQPVQGFIEHSTRVRAKVGDSYFVIDTRDPEALVVEDLEGNGVARLAVGLGPRPDWWGG